MYFCKIVSSILLLLLLNSCSSARLEDIDKYYYINSNIETSYKYAKNYVNNDFLWSSYAGILAFQKGDFKTSMELLDSSETIFENYRDSNIALDSFKVASSILLSNGMFDYEGNLFEAVFVNYYKALLSIGSGDYARARVEFNRANDRQRRSKEFFESEIIKLQDKLNGVKQEYSSKVSNIDNNKMYSQIDKIIQSNYKNLNHFDVYNGYINPLVTYISGIFFMTQKDYSKANNLLKEAYGITKAPQILHDIEISMKKSRDKYYTYIIIEDGKIPIKMERQISFPIFLITNEIFSIDLAFPFLSDGEKFHDKYYLKDSRNNIVNAFEVNNLNNLISNELRISMPFIITNSVISAVYKASLQYFLNEKFGFFGLLGGAVFSRVTTNADIRSLRILPYRQLVIRLENSIGTFKILGDDRKLLEFCIDESCSMLCVKKDNLIYIRVLPDNIAIMYNSLGG